MSKDLCFCGHVENQEHIYSCKILNEKKEIIEYNRIFEENVNAQKQVYERFVENIKLRKQKIENHNQPADPRGRSTIITKPSCNSNG